MKTWRCLDLFWNVFSSSTQSSILWNEIALGLNFYFFEQIGGKDALEDDLTKYQARWNLPRAEN